MQNDTVEEIINSRLRDPDKGLQENRVRTFVTKGFSGKDLIDWIQDHCVDILPDNFRKSSITFAHRLFVSGSIIPVDKYTTTVLDDHQKLYKIWCVTETDLFMIIQIDNFKRLEKVLKIDARSINNTRTGLSMSIKNLVPWQGTPLHYATMKNFPKCVEVLLMFNADQSITVRHGTYDGKTALQIAILKNFPDVQALLLPTRVVQSQNSKIIEDLQTLVVQKAKEVDLIQRKLENTFDLLKEQAEKDPNFEIYYPKMELTHLWEQHDGYKMIDLTASDKLGCDAIYDFITDFWSKNSTFPITKISLVDNSLLRNAWGSRVATLNRRADEDAFKPLWKKLGNVNRRNAILERLEKFHIGKKGKIYIIPIYHGTRKENIPAICRTGYANLAKTDPGYFGGGIYGTYQPHYAARVYGDGVCVLNFLVILNPLPVIWEDMEFLLGKGNWENCDVHYAPVVPVKPLDGKERVYIGVKEGQVPVYDEFCTFQEGNLLPYCVIHYEK